MSEQDRPRAGAAYLNAIRNDPEAQAGLARARLRLELFNSVVQSPTFKRSRRKQEQAIAALAEAWREVTHAAGQDSAAMGLDPPKTLEDLQALAYRLGFRPETILEGRFTLRDLCAMAKGALAGPVGKQRIRQRGRTADTDAKADGPVANLERVTPAFDADSGQWVKNKLAAGLEGLETRTLAQYRTQGIANAPKTLGKDPDGRVWRRPGTPSSHPWYLRSTLKSSQPKET